MDPKVCLDERVTSLFKDVYRKYSLEGLLLFIHMIEGLPFAISKIFPRKRYYPYSVKRYLETILDIHISADKVNVIKNKLLYSGEAIKYAKQILTEYFLNKNVLHLYLVSSMIPNDLRKELESKFKGEYTIILNHSRDVFSAMKSLEYPKLIAISSLHYYWPIMIFSKRSGRNKSGKWKVYLLITNLRELLKSMKVQQPCCTGIRKHY